MNKKEETEQEEKLLEEKKIEEQQTEEVYQTEEIKTEEWKTKKKKQFILKFINSYNVPYHYYVSDTRTSVSFAHFAYKRNEYYDD